MKNSFVLVFLVCFTMHAQGKSDNAKANSLTWHTDVKEV
jgi:hypothetical protein